MRPLWALLLYIAFVFVGGALLAPVLWHVAQFASHAFPKLAQTPFHRFMDRSFLVLALVGLWPLLRALGATSISEVGLNFNDRPFRNLVLGAIVGFGSLAILAGIVIFKGSRAVNHDITTHKIISTVLGGLITAIMVGTLEEILFRGGVFGGLRRVLSWPFALIISSAVYAIVHFLRKAEWYGPIHWNSGLLLLAPMLSGFGNMTLLIPAFFNLTLVGILLGLAYQRTGTLYFSIGMHAGWIFWLKTYGGLTVDRNPAAHWLWGSGWMIDGWLSSAVLVATLLVFRLVCPRQKTAPFDIHS